MIEQMIANLIPISVLLAVLGFFIKRWMDALETQVRSLCREIAEVKDTKLDKSSCDKNQVSEKESWHEVWEWLKYHKHAENGAVLVPSKD